ncbi:MAG TPA: arginine--tRNA ligase [Candidatus Hydrogenedentes bacterium]|nr:arginine--tRNA ligase [Candidatus Hydrogenedentota bacterium]
MNPFQHLAAPIAAAYPGLEPDDIGFGPPPNLELGDVAVHLFQAAKKLRTAPAKLAAALAGADLGPRVIEAQAAGPYLNLRVDRAAFAREIVDAILASGPCFGASGLGAGKRALIEHTSINPNASPHIGRARNAMIGDSLARLFRFEGFDLEVHYYVNDIGKQIGLLVLAAADREDLAFDQILRLYVEANARAEADPEFAAQGFDLLAKMEEGDPDTRARFRKVVDLCLRGQLGVLGRLGVAYDCFDYESAYLKDPRLDPVFEALRAKDALFVDDEQRLVVDLVKIGYPQQKRDAGRFFVLMRANGSSMYGYRDLAYNIDKEGRGADLNLVILGEDHKTYQRQIAQILDNAGHRAPEAVYYAYILLKESRDSSDSTKMSTRQGNVVLLSDFLDQATALAAARVAEQCHDLSPEDQRTIAAQVAVGAVRFSVLRVSPNKNVMFDMEANLSFTGDTGPYIQYSCARIQSILRKYGKELPQIPAEEFPLTTDAEWALLLKLADLPNVVAGCLNQRTTSPVAQYALETARLFTTFYHECPVLTAETPALVQARAQLCAATRQTIANALYLLGIEVPERM